MPASASVPFPTSQAGPHVYGAKGAQHSSQGLTRSKHGHSQSADYRDPRAAVAQKPDKERPRLSEQVISKPLPSKPRDPDSGHASIYAPMTEAQRFKELSLQKLEGKHTRPKHQVQSSQAPPAVPTTTATLSRSKTVGIAPPASSASHGSGQGQTHLRRKPVRQFDESSFTGTFKWTPGTEPLVLQQTPTEQPPTPVPAVSKSRNRAVGLYRDPPSHHHSGSWPANRHDGRDALRTSTKAPGPGPAESGNPQPQGGYIVSSASLGRHHSASASIPSVVPTSARTTVQAVFPGTDKDKTPVASTFQFPSNTNTNTYDNKRYKHASTPVTQDVSVEERRRKNSHHRAGSESTHGLSPSSCSTTGSSHCDTYQSATSQTGSHHKRPRGLSDACPPQQYPAAAGRGRKGSEISVVKSSKKDKEKEDVPFLQRVRTRSNSFTKAVTKMIKYPSYLKKERDQKRSSKQQNEFAAASAPVLVTSDRGLATAPAYAAPYSHSLSSSTSTATTTSATSPTTGRNPVEGLTQMFRGQSDHGHGHSHSSHGHGHGAPPLPRPNKLLSHKEKQLREQYRFSPMTAAAHDTLEQWEGIGDLPPRNSGIHHVGIQVKSSRVGGPVTIPLALDRPVRHR